MSLTCRHLGPTYGEIKSKLSRYYNTRLFSITRSKESKTHKDTLADVIELYDGGGAKSGHPTNKDQYEISSTVPARSPGSNIGKHSHTATETDTSQLIHVKIWTQSHAGGVLDGKDID
ncbi:MAG: hypothetical protein Q9191_005607 [Dirinaria sp. TL-2023a]